MTLQEKGEKLVLKFNLPHGLESIGEVHLVGNIALATTVKPDIDVQLYTNPTSWKLNSKIIIDYFATFGLNSYITRDLKESHKYLVSFEYWVDEIRWTIDITQTVPSKDYLKDAYRFYLDYQDQFTDQKTKTIRELKKHFLDLDMLHHSMSFYIYQAVLEKEAISPDDVLAFIKSNQINIKRFKK